MNRNNFLKAADYKKIEFSAVSESRKWTKLNLLVFFWPKMFESLQETRSVFYNVSNIFYNIMALLQNLKTLILLFKKWS